MNKTDLVVAVTNRGSIAKVLADHGVDLVTGAGSEVETIIRGDATERLAKEIVDAVVSDTIDTIALMLAAGEQVNIRRFGRFDPRDRKPVTRLNPATGEPIHVPAKRSVGFVPSQTLKDRLNAGGAQ